MSGLPTWTILVPTLGQRRALFERLMAALLPQTEPYHGRVKVRAWWNNGAPSLPEIRQHLVESVATDYLSFIDDDDLVPAYFVEEVMSALAGRPDYVGWQVHYVSNGRDHGLVDHSLKHGGWREVKEPSYALLRDISHINPMRTDAARRGDFRVANRGQVEDKPWADQIRQSGELKTEVYIGKPMYEYLYDRRTTAWRSPQKVRDTGMARSSISHPNFEWAAEVKELAIIVPSRSRPENVAKVAAAWEATGARAQADLVFALDDDDPRIEDYDRAIAALPWVKSVAYDTWTPMVPKLDRTARALATRYWALGFAGDDHLPRTDGWAGRYIDALHTLKTGMVYADDGYHGGKLSTEWAVTSDVVRALDRMIPAPVEHLYCDNAIMELFGAAGALKYLGDVTIEHMHPVAGKADSDEQYKRVNSSEQYGRDRSAYQAWKTGLMGEQLAAVRSLYPNRPDVRLAARRPQPQRTPRMSRRSPLPRRIREIRSVTPDDIGLTLADFSRLVPEDQAIVEIGVHRARTTLLMSWGAREGAGAHVWGIDPWDSDGNVYGNDLGDQRGLKNWARYHVMALGYSNHITLIQGFSTEIAGSWDGSRIGLLFIDGDHSYEGAMADVLAWAPHLAAGARIAVDDYGHPEYPGVKQAIDELVEAGKLTKVEVFHDRLAVTALVQDRQVGLVPARPTEEEYADLPVLDIAAITSEGVSPSPEPAAEPDDVDQLFADVKPADLWDPAVVHQGELQGMPSNVTVGTSVDDLTLPDLRALAKQRGIVLGRRKDLKSEVIQALRDGA